MKRYVISLLALLMLNACGVALVKDNSGNTTIAINGNSTYHPKVGDLYDPSMVVGTTGFNGSKPLTLSGITHPSSFYSGPIDNPGFASSCDKVIPSVVSDAGNTRTSERLGVVYDKCSKKVIAVYQNEYQMHNTLVDMQSKKNITKMHKDEADAQMAKARASGGILIGPFVPAGMMFPFAAQPYSLINDRFVATIYNLSSNARKDMVVSCVLLAPSGTALTAPKDITVYQSWQPNGKQTQILELPHNKSASSASCTLVS